MSACKCHYVSYFFLPWFTLKTDSFSQINFSSFFFHFSSPFSFFQFNILKFRLNKEIVFIAMIYEIYFKSRFVFLSSIFFFFLYHFNSPFSNFDLTKNIFLCSDISNFDIRLLAFKLVMTTIYYIFLLS